MNEKWLEVWRSNYANETSVAKRVMVGSKDTYKGDKYIPWALMVGALYELDPKADIEKCENEYGGFVFTDTCHIKTIKEGVETTQTVLSHMVKIKVTFMGKVFTETYPIQDNDYGASKVYDQNKVNKAQQRCLTRVISLATGIGWSIYEQTEAQFEDDGKEVVKKPFIPQVEPAKAVEVNQNTKTDNNPSVELSNFIIENKDNIAMLTLLTNYNEVLQKKYVDDKGNAIILSPEDGFDALVAKVSVLDNPEKMLKGLRKAVGA